MIAVAALQANTVDFVLPVTLSKAARRQSLVTHGEEPREVQWYEPGPWESLAQEARERLVDSWVRLGVDSEWDGFEGERTAAAVTRYDHLERMDDGDWRLRLSGRGSSWLGNFVVAKDGRTVGIVDRLRAELDDPEALDALLAGAPIVQELAPGAELDFDTVMEAYGRAFELVGQLEHIARAGVRVPAKRGATIDVTDKLIVAHPDGDWPRVIMLREADPSAFEQARKLLEPFVGDDELAHRVAQLITEDTLFVDIELGSEVIELIAHAVDQLDEEQAAAEHERAAAEEYETERAAWIEKNGSPRLRLAAARGYKHDGIYRDERLARELPGFVTLPPKGLSAGEVINPTEAALSAESEVLGWVADLKMSDVEVRLAWVRPPYNSDLVGGEYVEVKNFLGRHTVYKQVEGGAVAEREDIPF